MVQFTTKQQKRRWRATALLLLLMLLAACSRGTADQSDVQVTLDTAPQPLAVGMATVNISLAEPDGTPISGADVRLEGNMTHAGMQPVQAQATETAPGRYEAPLQLTMGGEWFVVVRATLPDGRALEREVELGTVGT